MTQRLCEECFCLTTNSKFCSRSCAAKANNKFFPKRSLRKINCLKCGVQISRRTHTDRRSVCDKCLKVDWDNLTLRELQEKRSHQKSVAVRAHARRKFLAQNSEPRCAKCGYTTHVEVCHIKPIASFPETATLQTVNSLSNLVGLCPNHHWEFDHGHLDFTEFENLHSEGFPKEAQ